MRLARFAPLAALLLIGACAGHPASGTSPARDPNVLTLEDIQNGLNQNLGNAYDLVARVRPQWLSPSRTGVTGQLADVAVWMDNQRLGGPLTMRNVPLRAITLIRYLTPSEAQGQLGLDNLGGAIVLSSR